MIKAVAQAIPYVLTIFKIPTTLCKKIESSIAQFWWRNYSTSKSLHWCHWSEMCKLTKDCGWFGIQKLNYLQFGSPRQTVVTTLTRSKLFNVQSAKKLVVSIW
ncbi:putative mitochondrial protein [Apostasia shenzhenica]|uniref:Putative mitochondrial protein n=1 Tax=Apostasia shenzhenica TaxID=1088818 RepID=A0A2I0B751_9ASPA|nr:putative mitochondrial protein [Apostasia shenzhenica]